ncbi:MAG: hypothetical protein M1823_002728 [Watsoniomyces obsoletus]|nr:MAG: hypothetical protein M1823_002728 [Watsoniomyces obsoletus]
MEKKPDEQRYSLQARAQVRRYTDELEVQSQRGEPIGTVAESLVEVKRQNDSAEQQKLEFERLDEQQRSAISNQTAEVFRAQSKKLEQAVKDFEQTLRSKDRIPRDDAKQYTIADYIKTVEAIEARRAAKKEVGFYEKSMGYVHRLCKGIDQHRTMLEMIPSGNYTSVFLGGMKTVVAASVNHEKIDQDLVQSLERINGVANQCAKERELCPTVDMLDGFLDLYTLIFEFLSEAIQWYQKRSSRFGSSFNEKFKDKFDQKLADIERKSNSIWREAGYGGLLKSQMVLDYLPKLGTAVESQSQTQGEILRQNQQIKAEITHQRAELQHQGQLLQLLGQSVKGLLLENAEKNIRDRQSQSPSQPTVLVVNLTLQSSSSHTVTATSSTVLETSWDFQALHKFFMENSISPGLSTSSIYLDNVIVFKIQEWTSTPLPQFLGIIGQPELGDMTAASTMATTYLSLVQQVGVPCLSYFCKRSNQPNEGNSHTPETRAMVAMLYALLWQLSKIVTEDQMQKALQEEPNLLSKLDKLDGSPESIPDAITLLGQLLIYAPLTTFGVIYGLHHLDDPSTTEHVKIFLRTLRDVHHNRVAKNPNMLLKVLFTISGRSEALQNNLRDEELVFTNHFRSVKTPTKPGPGLRRLELDLSPISPSKNVVM